MALTDDHYIDQNIYLDNHDDENSSKKKKKSNGNPKRFIQALMANNSIELFKLKSIQAIIHFKWHTYTQWWYIWYLLYFLVYVAFYLADLYYCISSRTYDENNEIIEDNRIYALSISLKCICFGFNIGLAVYECLSSSGFCPYFSDPWNYIDIGVIIFYTPIAIID